VALDELVGVRDVERHFPGDQRAKLVVHLQIGIQRSGGDGQRLRTRLDAAAPVRERPRAVDCDAPQLVLVQLVLLAGGVGSSGGGALGAAGPGQLDAGEGLLKGFFFGTRGA